MWIRIIFLLFCGTALAVDHSSWESGRQYQYLIRSRTLTALEKISPQYAGIVVKGLLTVQRKDDETLQALISEPKYAQIHTELPDGWESHIPDSQLELRELPLTQAPFEIKIKHGVVRDLVVDRKVPTWELNVLKSVVSQLQVDTQGENAKWSKTNQVSDDDSMPYAMFRAMEDTVSGKCEVLYDIAPLPEETLLAHPELVPFPTLKQKGQFIEVIKTKNYEKCDQRMGYHFGITGKTKWEPGANDNGAFLSKSSTSRIVISGSLKRFTIQSSVTTNKMFVSPKLNDHQSGVVVSRMNLTLVKVNEKSQPLGSPQSPQSTGNLVYTYNDPFAEMPTRKLKKATISQDSRGVSESSGSSESSNEIFRQYAESSSASSESASSISYEERDYWQSKPKLDEAPESPLLPYFIGYQGTAIRMVKGYDAVDKAKELVDEISEDLQHPDDVPKSRTLEKFTILCSWIRTMNRKQIAEVDDSLPTPRDRDTQDNEEYSKKKSAWAAFRDAVAQAGTGPAFLTIKDWVEKRKITGMEAAGIFMHLPEVIRTPTTEYVEEFFSLIKSPEVQKQNYLNASALLAFANLVHESQINNRSLHNRYPVHSFGRMSPKYNENVFSKYITYLADELKEAVRNRDSPKIQIYTIALGKIGHPKILGVFEPYIEGKIPVTYFQRLVMVTSLGRLAEVYPRVVRPVFFKIYLNTQESHEVRCASVMLLMATQPTLGMMLRMAEFTRYDTNRHVNSAVISSITGAARLKQFEYRNLAHNARIAKNLLSDKYYDYRYSHFMMRDGMDSHWNLGYWLGFSYLGSDDSYVMRDLYIALERSIGGFKAPTIQMSLMMSSVKQFLYNYWNMMEYEDGDTLTEKIAKVLNIRSEPTQRFEGHVSYDNLVYAFDNSIFDKFLRLIPEMTNRLSKGLEWNSRKFLNNELIVAFPTETGLPFLYTLKTPHMWHSVGKFKFAGEESTAKATVDGRLTSSKTIQGRIGFITPFDHHRYVAGMDISGQVSLPGRIDAELNMAQKRVQIKLRPRDNSPYKFYHYSVVPFTAKHNIFKLKPVPLGENAHQVFKQKSSQMNFEYPSDSTWSLSYEGEMDNGDISHIPNWSDPVQKYVFPWSYNEGRYFKLEVYSKDGMDEKNAVVFSIFYDHMYNFRTKSADHKPWEKSEIPQIPDEQPGSENRRKMIMETVAKGISSPKSYALELAVQMPDESSRGYGMIFAFASSPSDETHHHLFHFYEYKPGTTGDVKICAFGMVRSPYTDTLDYNKVAQMDVTTEYLGVIQGGKECSKDSEITINAQLSRSEERKEYAESLPIMKKCKEEMKGGNKFLESCREARAALQVRDTIDATVQFNKKQELIKVLVALTLNAMKVNAYSNVIVNPLNPKNRDENTIEMSAKMTPDLRKLSVNVYPPNVDINIPNIPVEDSVFDDYVVSDFSDGSRKMKKVHHHNIDDYCIVDSSKAMTFDKRVYPIKLGQCSHVAMTTYPKEDPEQKGQYSPIPEEMRVSVLVSETQDNKKEIKIGLGKHEILLLPTGERPDVFVAGKKISYSQEKFYYYETENGADTVFEIYELPDGSVQLYSEDYGVGIIYDRERVKIMASDLYRNAVRGLCGNYDSQPENDFTTPSNCMMKRPEVFVASYAMTDKSCEGPALQYAKEIPQSTCLKHQSRHSNVISDREAGRTPSLEGKNWGYHSHDQKATAGQGCNAYKTHVFDKDGKVCFTTRPVPTCGRGCSPEKMKPKMYDLFCLPNGDKAREMKRRIEAGANPDLSHKPATTNQYIDVPVRCKPNF